MYNTENLTESQNNSLSIPECDDTIYMIGGGFNEIRIIGLDARQGYHQVKVKKSDKDKIAFFSTNNKNYCFNFIPFIPTNKSPFNIAVIKYF